MRDAVRIGGASGFWGDSMAGPVQLVQSGAVDFLVFDYLAELTMGLLAKARSKDAGAGYATDFVTVAMRAVLRPALAQGIRIIANAGGVNPHACARALQALARELGVTVTVAVVDGDDVQAQLPVLREQGTVLPAQVASANAYLGALPIKAALDVGAQVVITGRCVDSAVTLGPLLHVFGWSMDDYDLLAAGSLAGHLIECGCQGVGGLHTDWDTVPDWANSGYPIIECRRDGVFTLTKPVGTGGLVTPATVAEQLLYEIGDPARYLLPDVTCDFTGVTLTQTGLDAVQVQGARGLPPPSTYKVCATYMDGWRCAGQLTVVGFDAAAKAQRTAEAILQRTRLMFSHLGMADYTATHIDILGGLKPYASSGGNGFEAVMWLAVSHTDQRALELFAREIAPAATSWAPGTTGAAGRPAVTPLVRQAALAIDKAQVAARVVLLDSGGEVVTVSTGDGPVARTSRANDAAAAGQALCAIDGGAGGNMASDETSGTVQPGADAIPARTAPLIALAYARSGDKGDISNIGVIARRPQDVPLLRELLTEQAVAGWLAPLVKGRVTRYELPGIHAFNFVCEQALDGGGMASLRNDPLGKGMAQILLAMPVQVPHDYPME
ncbi:acyclic terpene utilization AtuA family protein [Duganella sp. FT92W]|uniref:Acyclic terpene utilization AtuA family protein n=1 Tax=Pseudoduganella rivuli TaxID=2666085 RepID=A0A7X2IM12_9BURK|nr:acyclic terpene utilization AtuA family protein [Pseudoduganella rivuli]